MTMEASTEANPKTVATSLFLSPPPSQLELIRRQENLQTMRGGFLSSAFARIMRRISP